MTRLGNNLFNLQSPQNPEQATKRFSLGGQTIRVIPRDQRERMLQNTPSGELKSDKSKQSELTCFPHPQR